MTSILRGIMAACLSTAILACSMPDPRAPHSRDIERGAQGGWVHVITRSGEVVKGELLALSPLGLYVLQGKQSPNGQWIEQRVVLVKSQVIVDAKVWGYENETFWSLGGGVLIYLNLWNIFIPISMAVTLIVADNELIKHSTASYPWKQMGALNQWARFPQGMPDGLDPDELIRSPRISTPAPQGLAESSSM